MLIKVLFTTTKALLNNWKIFFQFHSNVAFACVTCDANFHHKKDLRSHEASHQVCPRCQLRLFQLKLKSSNLPKLLLGCSLIPNFVLELLAKFMDCWALSSGGGEVVSENLPKQEIPSLIPIGASAFFLFYLWQTVLSQVARERCNSFALDQK